MSFPADGDFFKDLHASRLQAAAALASRTSATVFILSWNRAEPSQKPKPLQERGEDSSRNLSLRSEVMIRQSGRNFWMKVNPWRETPRNLN